MRAAFHHAEELAPRIRTFWFEPLEPIEFVAGQFTQLHVPHAGADERGADRWMTISSSPHQPLVGITTSLAAEHGSSFKRALQALQAGQEITLAAPIGDFVLPKNAALPLVFVAAGLGITPAASILSWLHHSGQQRDIMLLRFAEHAPEQSLPFAPLLEASVASGLLRYRLELRGATSWHEPAAAQGPDSPSAASLLAELARSKPEALFFLAGPEAFVESLAGALRNQGIAHYQIVADLFPGYM